MEKYAISGDLPPAWIFDVDGTLTTGPHETGPYEWGKVSQDLPRQATIEMANALSRAGYYIVVLSGREDICRSATSQWLADNDVPHVALFMRRTGDRRPDNMMKKDLFYTSVAPEYDIYGVVDDRDQVVKMWRELGLTCFQADYGNF